MMSSEPNAASGGENRPPSKKRRGPLKGAVGYTVNDFQNDLEMLERKFSQAGRSDNASLLEYTRQHYPPDVADYRAHLLARAIEFVVDRREELEAAELIGPGATIIPPSITTALYYWLVAVPWQAPPPRPDVEMILKNARDYEARFEP